MKKHVYIHAETAKKNIDFFSSSKWQNKIIIMAYYEWIDYYSQADYNLYKYILYYKWDSTSAVTSTAPSGSSLRLSNWIRSAPSSLSLFCNRSSRRLWARPSTRISWSRSARIKNSVLRIQSACYLWLNSSSLRQASILCRSSPSRRTSFRWVLPLRTPTLSSRSTRRTRTVWWSLSDSRPFVSLKLTLWPIKWIISLLQAHQVSVKTWALVLLSLSTLSWHSESTWLSSPTKQRKRRLSSNSGWARTSSFSSQETWRRP